VCNTWNGGVAHQGIQNANATAAFMVPGRNGTVWTATNESWRFTPAGLQASNLSYEWIDVNTGQVLGTGPTLSYFPTQNTKVTVNMTVIADCDTIEAGIRDTIDIIVTGDVQADFDVDIRLGCDNDSVVITNLSVSTAGGNPTYLWDFGDGTQSTAINPTHVYQQQGVYTIRLIASDNNCLDTLDKIVNLNHPVISNFVTFGMMNPPKPDSTCLGSPLSLQAGTSVPLNFITYDWDFGDGQTATLNTPNTTHNYNASGSYLVTLIVTDTLGCRDTSSRAIFVDNPPYVFFTPSPKEVCVGQPVFFSDTLAPFTKNFTWDFGDGKTLRNVHNPTYTWDVSNPSGYQVTLTGEYSVCPNAAHTEIIIVNDYPIVQLGPDTSICPGLTGSILLADY
jgi:FOG: PKD repeat